MRFWYLPSNLDRLVCRHNKSMAISSRVCKGTLFFLSFSVFEDWVNSVWVFIQVRIEVWLPTLDWKSTVVFLQQSSPFMRPKIWSATYRVKVPQDLWWWLDSCLETNYRFFWVIVTFFGSHCHKEEANILWNGAYHRNLYTWILSTIKNTLNQKSREQTEHCTDSLNSIKLRYWL